MPSLRKLLNNKDNYYTKLTSSFQEKTGLDIIKDGYDKKLFLARSCSIIIPFYKNYSFLKRNLVALCYQELPLNFKLNKVEIIIINDGSSADLKKIIEQTKKFYPVIYLKLKENYGRATARNLGLLYAKNEIILFLDEDIVPPKDFLATHLIGHEFLSKCIIVGFRHKIKFEDFLSHLNNLKQRILKPPNYKKDFRYIKFIPNEWKDIYKGLSPENFNKICYPLNESNYFKDFGRRKIFGVWSLPFMFLTSNASVPRKEILKVGGFDMRFKGWGMEDVHLGSKLIANGLYLIPNLHLTVYHLVKKSSKKEKDKRIKEYERNLKFYDKLQNENLDLFEKDEWEEKMRNYFKNKFTINKF
jgi:GT2 family glycosyltransferase